MDANDYRQYLKDGLLKCLDELKKERTQKITCPLCGAPDAVKYIDYDYEYCGECSYEQGKEKYGAAQQIREHINEEIKNAIINA